MGFGKYLLRLSSRTSVCLHGQVLTPVVLVGPDYIVSKANFSALRQKWIMFDCVCKYMPEDPQSFFFFLIFLGFKK